MRRWLYLLYGLGAYASFLTSAAYAFLMIGGYLPGSPFRAATADSALRAWLANAGLVVLFGVQHSVMARPWFKRRWTRLVPQVVERSTYVLVSSVALVLLVALWQPAGFTLWDVQSPALRALLLALSAAGWLMVVGSSFLINHFDLFGLRQVWNHFRGVPSEPLPFEIPGMYRWVRHPLYVGWLVAFWSTPTMTVSHLLFAGGLTLYILAAIRWEEADLVAHFGEQYAAYRRRVPMLIPWPPAKESNAGCVPSAALRETIGKV
jgi:protein-S-isoprenylcysteine O-methyltransferase Ste14